MPRIRVGPVRVGGNRKVSFTAHAGPVGVTFGGGYKRRRGGGGGSRGSSTDNWDWNDSGGGNFSPELQHYWSVMATLARDVEAEYGPDTTHIDANNETFAGMFGIFMALGLFTVLNLSHPMRTVWVSLLALLIVQTVSSPAEILIPLVGDRKHPSVDSYTESSLNIMGGMWARARNIPVVTVLPFYLPIVIHHLVGLTGVFPAPHNLVRTFLVYLAAMFGASAYRVKKTGGTDPDVGDVLKQNLRNTFFLGYSRNSRARLALLQNRRRWVEGFAAAIARVARTDPEFKPRGEFDDELRELQAEIKMLEERIARSESTTQSRSYGGRTDRTLLRAISERHKRKSKERAAARATWQTPRTTETPRTAEPPRAAESPRTTEPPRTAEAPRKPETGSVSYADRLRMSARERDGRAASDD